MSPAPAKQLHCAGALLPEGWAADVLIAIDAGGAIASVQRDVPPGSAERINGAVVPGIANLHSHAFQRAMAGLTEVAGPAEDSFWTWRQVMYGFVARLTPEDVEAIAAQLYAEMLRHGYTAVAEFHYLHHDPQGHPYADRCEMAERLIAAARSAGIAITLLPVLYAHGGFGGAAPGGGQRRFLNSPEALLGMIEDLRARHRDDPQVRIGAAAHSLRAVTPAELATLAAGLHALDPAAPLHLHIAEQTREVDECLAWCGARPVQWLLANQALDARWCLVHATHLDDAELAGLAASGAVAGLCPSTEANLGDGIFPALEYQRLGGRWGIGSDSHVATSPVEELRLLEYGQRLIYRRRNLLAGGPGASTGARLYREALGGGAQALARPCGSIAAGQRADLVVLDTGHPALAARRADQLLDAWLFAGNASPVQATLVGGRAVAAGQSPGVESQERFAQAMHRIVNQQPG